ncbi:winged helix-turn-helix domain-containing protein [Haloprofundus sp. MHR1]|uniref:helix-turn-helix transcriptional regulator n=1 Tax=Haloprofundus sp. MHR1 TaxID=2572921 RepID=UPI0010BF0BF1|nr:MarR family transcriptional regulator [Haloprofundus sp. MHR1]QCJ45619.1 MarR family transcriptional regulator [Haloprofundus sp. MHR1]
MSQLGPSEIMAAVARRGSTLRALDEGTRKSDLVKRLSVSRSTVDRAIRELEGQGLVERTDDGYRRTLAGELVLSEYDCFTSRLGGIVEALDALGTLHPKTEFDTALLDGADVVYAEKHSPHEPVTRHGEVVSRAETVRALAPAVLPQQVQIYHDRLMDGELEAQLALSEAVVERLVTVYDDLLREALSTGRAHIRQTTSDPPYSLVCAETPTGPEVSLLLYGDTGAYVFIGNDSPEAVEWAESMFAEWWAGATPLPMRSDQ